MMRKLLCSILTVIALVSIGMVCEAVEFGPNSAQITNAYVTGNARVGSWSFGVGAGALEGEFSYNRVLGTEFVSGAKIGEQVFMNVKCLKMHVLETHEHAFVTVSMAQDTAGNVWILKVYNHKEDVELLLGTQYKSMFMPAVPSAGEPASLIVPEEPEGPCTIEETGIAQLQTNYGTYSDCIRIECRGESFEYFCREAGEVRMSVASSPNDVVDFKAGYGPENLGDANGDGVVSLEDPIFSLQVLTGFR